MLDRRLKGRLVVLTYHRVLPRSVLAGSFSADGIIVTPDTFERHMKLLRRRFRVLTPDEAAKVLDGSMPLPPRACLVTFDDGWWDNLEYAAPILARHEVPALLFVATDYIGTNRSFWQEHLSHLLFLARRNGERSREFLQSLDAAQLLELSDATVRPGIREVITRLKKKTPAEIAQIIELVKQHLGALGCDALPAPTDRFLSWAQVTELTRTAPVYIGSHGCSHTPFVRLDPSALERELETSRETIREKTGITPNDLAYPNGDYDSDVARLTQQAGYRLAFSTERGYVKVGDDARTLRRINVHEYATSNDAMFVASLAGLF